MKRDITRIAIAQDGNSVSEHFGHCQSYAIFDVEDSIIYRRDDLPNPGHEPGRLPAFLAEHGVNLVIAGGMGPRAIEIFSENGIDVLIGIGGHTATLRSAQMLGFVSHFVCPQNVIRQSDFGGTKGFKMKV